MSDALIRASVDQTHPRGMVTHSRLYRLQKVEPDLKWREILRNLWRAYRAYQSGASLGELAEGLWPEGP